MRVKLRSFWLPKQGNSSEEYEDAFFPIDTTELSGTTVRVAIADGASEGTFSGTWSRLLVKHFCRNGFAEADFSHQLNAKMVPIWERLKRDYIERREREERPLQWFEEPGLDKGAFSTLLGLTIEESKKSRKWRLLALGDSCLFQLRANVIITALPLDKSEDFTNHPLLIGSNPLYNTEIGQHLVVSEGDWMGGDQFFLMTDALAEWFLRLYEAGEQPWRLVHDLDSDDPHTNFAKWIEFLRVEKKLHNDDVTLVHLEIPGAG